MHKHIKIQDKYIGNDLPLTVIAGPCQIESRSHALEMAHVLTEIATDVGFNFIYKSSFDKANRTSLNARRGVGLINAIDIFHEIKEKYKCPILTDVHVEAQCSALSDVVDIIQIPAFLCRQTNLLIEAAKTGKIINIKKGQFLAPWDINNVAEKISLSGNDNILLTDRGTSFGYNNLVSDMRSFPIMQETGYPVFVDATHSVQQPGALSNQSGGERKFVSVIARAAVAVGVAGVFLETHDDPDNAPSDGPCMLHVKEFPALIRHLLDLDKIVKR